MTNITKQRVITHQAMKEIKQNHKKHSINPKEAKKKDRKANKEPMRQVGNKEQDA